MKERLIFTGVCVCVCVVGQRVALPRRVARLYPAYGLYLYGEGLYAQETRALKLAGAPVLFLPGNAGSYKQGTRVAGCNSIEPPLRFSLVPLEACLSQLLRCVILWCYIRKRTHGPVSLTIERVLPTSKLALWAQWP